MRRWAAVLVVCAVIAVAAPAAGITNPGTVRINSITPNCTAQSTNRITITVSGDMTPSGASGSVEIYDPSGKQVGQAPWTASGSTWTARPTFVPSTVGYYEVWARNSFGSIDRGRWFGVPCPSVTLSPACHVPGQATTLTVNAKGFLPSDPDITSYGEVRYDYPQGPHLRSRGRIVIDGFGNFSATFNVGANTQADPPVTTSRDYVVRANDLDGHAAQVTWPVCASSGSTTTTTSTPGDGGPGSTTTTEDTTPGDDTTIPTVTVTTRPGVTIPGPTTTTTIFIPPPTPGATLTVTPALGPAGFVASATGTGFPAGQQVTLVWQPGIGTTQVTVQPDGTFTTQILIFPKDRLGPRTLVATGGGTTATAAFLVVPSTVEPSGRDVTQINRVRRHLNR